MTPDERAALRAYHETRPAWDSGDVLLVLDALDAETARADAAEARYESLKGRTVGPYPEDACYETHAYFTPCAACERDEARAEVERLRRYIRTEAIRTNPIDGGAFGNDRTANGGAL